MRRRRCTRRAGRHRARTCGSCRSLVKIRKPRRHDDHETQAFFFVNVVFVEVSIVGPALGRRGRLQPARVLIVWSEPPDAVAVQQHELLDAFPVVYLARVDVAERVHGDPVQPVQLARHPARAADHAWWSVTMTGTPWIRHLFGSRILGQKGSTRALAHAPLRSVMPAVRIQVASFLGREYNASGKLPLYFHPD